MSLIQDETVRRFNRSARIVMLAELRMCAYLGLALSLSLTLTLSEQIACTQLAARQRHAPRSGNRRQSTERAPSEGHSPPQAINPYGLTPTTQSQAEGACRDLSQACGVRPGVRPSWTAFCCHRGRDGPIHSVRPTFHALPRPLSRCESIILLADHTFLLTFLSNVVAYPCRHSLERIDRWPPRTTDALQTRVRRTRP